MASPYLSLSHSEIMIKSHDYQQVKSNRKVLFLIYKAKKTLFRNCLY